jgi:hypothetical protein
MKDKLTTSTSPKSSAMTAVSGKPIPKKTAQDKPRAATDAGHKIDRPGFDLSGSSDDTHAGTGLGLGTDASETPGDRRLPGRRLENKLTIPRWGGPEPKHTIVPVKKAAVPKTEVVAEIRTSC